MQKRQSAFEDLIDVVARLRWWRGVLLTLLSFNVLPLLVETEISASKGLQGLGDNFGRQAVKTLAMFGPYLLPLAFLIGAVIPAFGRWKPGGLQYGLPSKRWYIARRRQPKMEQTEFILCMSMPERALTQARWSNHYKFKFHYRTKKA